MALKEFTFNGKNSSFYGLRVLDAKVYTLPEKNVETFSIPGRSGDILLDNKNFNMVMVSYHVLFPKKDLAASIQKLKEMLYVNDPTSSQDNLLTNYHKLTDTYDPEFYRMAYFAGPADWETMMNLYGETTLNFVCMPQKYYNNYFTSVTKEVPNGQTVRFNVEDLPYSSSVPFPLSKGRFFPMITIGIFGAPSAGGELGIGIPGVAERMKLVNLDEIGTGYLGSVFVDCYEEQVINGLNNELVGDIINDHAVLEASYGIGMYDFPYWTISNPALNIRNDLGLSVVVKIDWRCHTI